MSIMLVTFNVETTSVLNTSQSRKEALENRLRVGYAYARLTNNSYLIDTTQTPVEVRDHLRQGLILGDQIYVGIVNPPAAWAGMDDAVSSWIKARLVG